jgi:putative transposase
MPRKIYHVHFTQQEREQLETFVKQGKQSARAMTRARILLFADEQKSDEEIAALLGVSRPTVYHMRKQYHERTSKHILDLLQEQPRSGQPIKVDTRVESHITHVQGGVVLIGEFCWVERVPYPERSTPSASQTIP